MTIRKQGVIKKHFGTEKACVATCRKNMAKKFVKILAKHNHNILTPSEVSYAALKEKCRSVCEWDYFSTMEPYAKILPDDLKMSRHERRLKLDGFQVN